ncbi:MAG: UvrD-helicase domain-containing protein [Nitrospirae bacterium]|nr:UvrD-helicase domain-containing protein [Nitrospirota bacterium]
MSENNFIISAAGSGKTTRLVEEALSVKNGNVLITTFTETNEKEIRDKILKTKKYIPSNVTVQTWFSFLLQHGVRPYQGVMNDDLFSEKIGFYLIEGKSGLRYHDKSGKPIYWGEDDFNQFYFTKDLKIYSDKISKFVFECNKRMRNEVISRLTRIYPHIFIDEVQDLAGWDLELLKLFFQSPSRVLMVGDPRQSTYSTNDSSKHKPYRGGGISTFITDKCPNGICGIDTTTLNKSHRNNREICEFSSRLYPEHMKSEPCDCQECRENMPDHQGVFLVKEEDVEYYRDKYRPVILRYSNSKSPDYNYGASKGLTFRRVLIYPTEKIREYLKSGDVAEIETIKAKFYVAVTRARYSVGIVCDEDSQLVGVRRYNRNE